METYEKILPDADVVIEGLLSKQIINKELKFNEVIIHEAMIAMFEHLASLEKAEGHLGIDELEKLKQLSREDNFAISYHGKRQSQLELKNSTLDDLNNLIMDLAWETGSTLFTTKTLLKKVAAAKGINFVVCKKEKKKELSFEKFFDKETMSVHLRENLQPYAKKGMPGNWQFVQLRKKVLEKNEVKEISREILEETKVRDNAFIEIERAGSTIVQLDRYRIVITRPPFSDGWEITAVRPVKKMSLEEYNLDENVMTRINEQAEGLVIAGAPGHGKSTFASALAEHYANKNKTVKTIEAPRDLILGDNVTQYAISHGDAQEIHDILLLSRPDYTIFDEMRNRQDFELFSDLRLAGIGLAGVVHATAPIDAIQRFIGKIEMGVIPQIVDTVIFIKGGKVEKVLGLKMTVKVPSGMTEADLARPVVVVNDFLTNKPEYEIYSYGEETVVIPITPSKKSPSHALAARKLEDEIGKMIKDVKAEVINDHKARVFVPKDKVAILIGKKGRTIEKIEKKLGISIDVQEMETPSIRGKNLEVFETNEYVVISTDQLRKSVDIFINGDFLLTATTSKDGEIKINKKSELGNKLLDALELDQKIEVR